MSPSHHIVAFWHTWSCLLQNMWKGGLALSQVFLSCLVQRKHLEQVEKREGKVLKGGLIFQNISVLRQRKSSGLLSPCPKVLDDLHSTRGNYALPCSSDTHTHTPSIYHSHTPSHFLISAASPTHPQFFFPSCTFLGFSLDVETFQLLHFTLCEQLRGYCRRAGS